MNRNSHPVTLGRIWLLATYRGTGKACNQCGHPMTDHLWADVAPNGTITRCSGPTMADKPRMEN
jgi:hypothetical protein